MITQAERDYVVDLFFTISPYAKNSKDKEESQTSTSRN